MSPTCSLFAGIDVGSTWTKVALIDEKKNIAVTKKRKSGTNFTVTARETLADALKAIEKKKSDLKFIISTGYGRSNVSLARAHKTEISCHAKGCYHFFPHESTIIDIGGQDNKVITIDKKGQQVRFKMNRKCAAGTGAFIEEMAYRLEIDLDELNTLASQSESMVKLGSYCTVFSATEVLEFIRDGKNIGEIIKGIFHSVIQRVMEMDALSEKVVMTGGVVANNPFLATMMAKTLNRKITVSEHAQFTGAIGAALYALEKSFS